MTLEIRELVIRATVVEGPRVSEEKVVLESRQGSTEDLIEECVRRVLEELELERRR